MKNSKYQLTHRILDNFYKVTRNKTNRYRSRSITFLPQVYLSQVSLPQDRKFDWIKEGF